MRLNLRIRRFDPATDYETIYGVYSDMKEQYRIFDMVSLNSVEYFPKIFERTLSYGYQDFFMVTEEDTNRFIGFVISYDYKPNDGHLKVLVYVDSQYRSGYGGALAIKFFDYLFTYYSIRKVYSEVYGYNEPSLHAHVSLGFIEEARLKEYRYYKGQYWDYVIYAIDKESFYEKNQPYLNGIELPKGFA